MRKDLVRDLRARKEATEQQRRRSSPQQIRHQAWLSQQHGDGEGSEEGRHHLPPNHHVVACLKRLPCAPFRPRPSVTDPGKRATTLILRATKSWGAWRARQRCPTAGKACLWPGERLRSAWRSARGISQWHHLCRTPLLARNLQCSPAKGIKT